MSPAPLRGRFWSRQATGCIHFPEAYCKSPAGTACQEGNDVEGNHGSLYGVADDDVVKVSIEDITITV